MALCAINPSCKLWIHEKESTVKKIIKKIQIFGHFNFLIRIYIQKKVVSKSFLVFMSHLK